MGKGTTIKAKEDGQAITVEMPKEEALQLRGNMWDIHLFAHQLLISTKPNQDFLAIPKELRNHTELAEDAECQRLDTKDKAFLIFTVKKII